ncbi:hypothetical protein AB0L40_00620 [Patulibacter sp. NPDC049589]|uniref:hypothetical protein n=1 Tax=Patulibacter sp. NPDC049589 TaxID=3154731 RepID=UPI0034190197
MLTRAGGYRLDAPVRWIVLFAISIGLVSFAPTAVAAGPQTTKCGIGGEPLVQQGLRITLVECPATISATEPTRFRIKLTARRTIKNLKVSMVAHLNGKPTRYKAKLFRKGRSKTLTYWLEAPERYAEYGEVPIEVTIKGQRVSVLLLCNAKIGN